MSKTEEETKHILGHPTGSPQARHKIFFFIHFPFSRSPYTAHKPKPKNSPPQNNGSITAFQPSLQQLGENKVPFSQPISKNPNLHSSTLCKKRSKAKANSDAAGR
jgi:hypothetical protein